MKAHFALQNFTVQAVWTNMGCAELDLACTVDGCRSFAEWPDVPITLDKIVRTARNHNVRHHPELVDSLDVG